jgi:hypothetical protein
MNTYPISKEHKTHELQYIKTILNNNNRTPYTPQKQKFATFTYIGTETRIITNLLKNTNIHIAYRTNNTIQHHLQPKNNTTDIYNMSGIYQMKCKDYQLKYIGQTSRNF